MVYPWESLRPAKLILRTAGPMASMRLLRLTAAGLARMVGPLLDNPDALAAVEVLEALADGLASPGARSEAIDRARLALWRHERTDAYRNRPEPERSWIGVTGCALRIALYAAASDNRPGRIREGIDYGLLAVGSPDAEAILGCVLGSLSPRPLPDAWRTPHVLHLAQVAYNDRDFEVPSILGDALEESGCTDSDLLAHLREHPRHARGCWALDAVLGQGQRLYQQERKSHQD